MTSFKETVVMKKICSFILLVYLVVLSISGLSFAFGNQAAQDSWRQIGPVGGSIHSLAVNPRNARHVYISTEDERAGVYRSLNAGKKWKKILAAEDTLGAIAIDPKNKKIVFVLGDEIIFKSKNMGKSWEEIQIDKSQPTDGPKSSLARFRRDIVIDPTNSNIVYIAGNKDYFEPGKRSRSVMAVGKSTDGGKTWIVSDLTPGANSGRTNALAINPNNPSEIFAAGYYTTGQKCRTGLFRSVNGGASWQQISMNQMEGAETMALDPNNSSHMLLGGNMQFFRSIDGGQNWQQCNKSCGGVVNFVFDPVNPNTIYGAGYSRNISKSIDGGATWTRILHDNMLGFCTGIAGGGKKPVYVSTTAGFYVSKNKGTSFSASNNGFSAAETKSVGVAPSNPRIVYAGAEASGFFKSKNIGKKWTKLSDECSYVSKISIHPSNPNKIFFLSGCPIVALNESSDGGKTRNNLFEKDLRDFDLDWNNPDTIYLAGSSKMKWDERPLQRIFKTTNGGKNWKTIVPIHAEGVLFCVAFDRLNPNVVYAGGYIKPSLTSYDHKGIIYKSVNGGLNWTEIYRPIWYIEDIVVDPVVPSTIYAGTHDNLFKSIDSGATWEQLPAQISSDSLLIHPKTPRIIIAAGWRGVFYSTDGGTNWNQSAQGLDSQIINCLDWNWKNKSLFAGTGNGGIYINNGLMKLLK